MSDVIRAQEKVLRQALVYWAVDSFDNNGLPVYDQPIEIKCRWDDTNEQYVGMDGSDHVSNAVVMVDRDITIQGVVWLGKLRDLENESIPMENPGAYEVRKFNKTPNRQATKFYREIYL